MSVISWPESWPFFVLNGGQQCDMIDGPCACGAYHHLDELYERLERAGIARPRVELQRKLTTRKRKALIRRQDQTRLNCERFAREQLRAKLGHDPDAEALAKLTAKLVAEFS